MEKKGKSSIEKENENFFLVNWNSFFLILLIFSRKRKDLKEKKIEKEKGFCKGRFGFLFFFFLSFFLFFVINGLIVWKRDDLARKREREREKERRIEELEFVDSFCFFISFFFLILLFFLDEYY